jgi:Protein of unknown function (DUF4232)
MCISVRPAKHGVALTLGIGLVLLGLSSCSSTATTAGSPTTPQSPTAAQSPTATAVTSCQTAQLTLGIQSEQSGASNYAYIYSLQNTSQQTCTLEGYPGVQLLSASQQPLTIGVSKQISAYLYNNQQPQLVTLAPAASGFFVLEWNYGVNGSGNCPGAAYVSVTPPGNQLSLPFPSMVDVCTGSVIVSPIEPTAFGYQ